MRARRPQVAARQSTELSVSDEIHPVRPRRRVSKEARKSLLYYAAFLCIFLVLPLILVVRLTPFFVFEHLRCRAKDKLLWHDRTVLALERGYAAYFSEPPLFGSEAYNRSAFWGTYDPARIFALRTRADLPLTLGVAWYDRAGTHPVRHMMYTMHNKVNGPRQSSKRRGDPEVMQVRWVVHDGIHYGKEMIKDAANRATFEIEFLKSPEGDAWHVRLHADVESESPLDVVLYLINADATQALSVAAPEVDNNGDWSPTVMGHYTNHRGDREPFTLRVYDHHNPLLAAPAWRIYGVRADAATAFALASDEAPRSGGTRAQRAAADGRGVFAAHGGPRHAATRLDLRDLAATHDTFTFIDDVDKDGFRVPDATSTMTANGAAPRNMIVMKKAYDTSFRLELSFSPAAEGVAHSHVARYDSLSTCQLTNLFRGRDKAIYRHARKVVRPWAALRNVSRTLLEHMAAQVVSEAFGSTQYEAGHYHRVDPALDASWEQRGVAVMPWSETQLLSPSPHIGRALAAVGSRTDDPVGLQSLTGLQLLFLVRWNKEMAKDTLASWLLETQDPQTGFLPTRAAFSTATRSMTAHALRYEHPTFATPPTLLFGLHELLREMARKEGRLKAKAGRRERRPKQRNTAAYYDREKTADEALLRRLLPALKRWRRWWHETQCGGLTEAIARNCTQRRPLEQWPVRPTGRPEDLLVYRWRGRDGARLATSGMEDYPRPFCPGEHVMEAHVDLFTWMALLSRLISHIETAHLGLPASVTLDWEAHLNAVHWDAAHERYADRVGCRSDTTTTPFSPYVGYVNLFPLLTGLLRTNATRVRQTMHLARTSLLTPYGLMSVSYDSVRAAREAGVEHDNLWMGYIWPSVNLMYLYALKATYMVPDPLGGLVGGSLDVSKTLQSEAATDYELLRQRMSETIRLNTRWWEFYSPIDGRGEGSKTYIGTYALLLGILNSYS